MTNANKQVRVEFGPCCFCGKHIDETDVDPCTVSVSTRLEKWQVWTCHGACFKARLCTDPEWQGMLDAAHL